MAAAVPAPAGTFQPQDGPHGHVTSARLITHAAWACAHVQRGSRLAMRVGHYVGGTVLQYGSMVLFGRL